MKVSKRFSALLVVIGLLLAFSPAHAFTIGIMQDDPGAAKKYKPLLDYLESKGIKSSTTVAPNYPAAAKMFSEGQIDAMFSGSGVAGTFILKDLANPVARPLGKDGNSTYSAVIVAKKGSPKFTGSADYFKGKKVAFTALASSGEIYYHSIPNIKSAGATVEKAASHSAALDWLSRGRCDYAIVKNRVWDKEKSKYPNLEVVGEDKEDNPDGTLIASKKADGATIMKIQSALLGLKEDSSPAAKAVLTEMNIQGFIKTTISDFKHTLELLKKAGIDKSFNFEFK